MPDEDAREDRARMFRRTTSVDRILTETEWSWITGNLVFLQREHPRFLAAASWYRKGLTGNDSLDDFCCYWRVIERLACSYADTSRWTEEMKRDGKAKKYVEQVIEDLFRNESVPEVLRDPQLIAKILKMRNDLSHGNDPITLEVIEEATSCLKPLEHAAFSMLHMVRAFKLTCSSPA